MASTAGCTRPLFMPDLVYGAGMWLWNLLLSANTNRHLNRDKVGLLVGFVTAIPPLCAAIAVYYVPRISEKLQERRYVASITFMSGAIGIAVSGLADSIPLVAIVALCVAAAGHLAMQPLYWTFPSSYLGGAAAASGIALINSIGNLGVCSAESSRLGGTYF